MKNLINNMKHLVPMEKVFGKITKERREIVDKKKRHIERVAILYEKFMNKWDRPHYKLYVRRSPKEGVFAADMVWDWIEKELLESVDK